MIGESLGPYEILEPLGAGGMGEVYRARDTKLERDVAIKVLPEDLAADPDRLARFEREAKLLASLNHANIGSIYGLEETNSVHFLVLELIEGESLEQRLRRGAIPVREALDIARQIAEALEAAHDVGIIHRDVKPANVLLTPKGGVKVLDFGIAKSTLLDGAANAALTEQATSLTVDGTLMGTPPYMAPEQIRGEGADKRADIWAFGCVLYEMLTGRGAFVRETVADTLVAVLEAEPDWDALPATTPRGVASLLRRCLRKNPIRRLRDIGDARIEIEEAASEARVEVLQGTGAAPTRWRHGLPWAIAAAVTIAALALTLPWPGNTAGPAPVDRVTLEVPRGLTGFTVSPSGRDIVVWAVGAGLARRPMSQYTTMPILGTEGAGAAWFAPDGESVVFDTVSELRSISLSSGGVITLADVGFAHVWGLEWGPAGELVVSMAGENPGLWTIPASGGVLTPIPEFSLDRGTYRFLEAVPGTSLLLATLAAPAEDLRLVALDLETGTETDLGITGSKPLFSPTGHILFARDQGGGGRLVAGSLWAVSFDPASVSVTSDPRRIVDEVAVYRDGWAIYDLAANGSLLYAPAQQPAARSLVWVTRDGRDTLVTDKVGPFGAPRLSPDGTKIAYGVRDADESLLAILDLSRDSHRQLMARQEPLQAEWSYDGQWIYHSGDSGVVRTRSDFSGDREQVTSDGDFPTSLSPDGNWLLYSKDGDESRDIWMAALRGESPAESLLSSGASEDDAKFSPDGDWVVYAKRVVSGGRVGRSSWQVFVQAFPGGVEQQVSIESGQWPTWSRDGTEIFYRRQDGMMMAVSAETEPALRLGSPEPLFAWADEFSSAGTNQYAVAADGRFLMLKEGEPVWPPQKIDVVLNWFQELKERVPARR